MTSFTPTAAQTVIKRVGRRPLGQILYEGGFITREQLDYVLEIKKHKEGRIGQLLVEQGVITHFDIAEALSRQLKVPMVNLNTCVAQPEAISLVPERYAADRCLLPLEFHEGVLSVAMAFPDDITVIDSLRALVGRPISVVVAPQPDIERAIKIHYRNGISPDNENISELDRQVSQMDVPDTPDLHDVQVDVDNAPAARSLTMIIDQAVMERASDIHLEPVDDGLRIRTRVDGIMRDAHFLPKAVHPRLMARIKILANLDISDRRRPQDGQFSVMAGGDQRVDIRVATIGTIRGEKATLRILDNSLRLLTLSQLGFAPDTLTQFQETLDKAARMVLVGGPTGSGKTTTLYAAINHIADSGRSIVTVEDPVEYQFPKITQIQVNSRAGVTFATGLRAIMRHDPDIILVGEIRDEETAKTAIQAALTGHFVLASIHANDTVGALFRLLDLGIKPNLISLVLAGSLAQRMVKCLCPHCRRPIELTPEERLAYSEEVGEEPSITYEAQGCTACSLTGYSGRTGIFEFLPASPSTMRMLLDGSSPADVRQKAIEEGLHSMGYHAMQKVKNGTTSVMEALRALHSIA
jgi:type II secretory ATPase GspE/PulE/Tfp pilus assembly ATPase PilB-like protein